MSDIKQIIEHYQFKDIPAWMTDEYLRAYDRVAKKYDAIVANGHKATKKTVITMDEIMPFLRVFFSKPPPTTEAEKEDDLPMGWVEIVLEQFNEGYDDYLWK